MQTLSNRMGVVLVSLLVVLAACVVPAAGAATVGTFAQQGTDDGSNGDASDDGTPVYDNATEVGSIGAIENGEIAADGEAAVFSFTLREGTQVEIGQGIGGGAAPVTLVDRNGAVLGRIADQAVYEGEEDLIRANASYTGIYYLKVDGEPGDRYSISESVTEPDANEPNDDRENATTAALGEHQQGTLVRGDVDYYAIELSAGEKVGVLTNATAAAMVTVYGPDGEALGSANAPSPGGERESEQGVTPVVNVTAEEGGTYYVAVSMQPNTIGNVNGEYTLTVVDTSADDGTTTTATSARSETTEDPTTKSDSVDDSDGTATDHPETTAADTDTSTGTDSGADVTTADSTTDAGQGTTLANEHSDETTSAMTPDQTTSARSETTAAPASEPNDGGTETAGGNSASIDQSVEETAVNGPGFGVVAALVALLVAALFAVRRD